jgi:hypothetical protein
VKGAAYYNAFELHAFVMWWYECLVFTVCWMLAPNPYTSLVVFAHRVFVAGACWPGISGAAQCCSVSNSS